MQHLIFPKQHLLFSFSDNSGVHSLGRYLQNPTFDPQSNTIEIKYTEGDPCRDNTQKKSAIITFICKPGILPPQGSLLGCLGVFGVNIEPSLQ